MTLRGKVQGGVIVLEGDEHLPEGLMVEIHAKTLTETLSSGGVESAGPTLSERLVDFIGKASDLPPDAALNHDHYLYGCAKR